MFVALGVLFTDVEKANGYLAGTKDQTVTTFTREQVETDNTEVVTGDPSTSTEADTSQLKLEETIEETLKEKSSEEIKDLMVPQAGVLEDKLKAVEDANDDARAAAELEYLAEKEKYDAMQFAYDLKLEQEQTGK